MQITTLKLSIDSLEKERDFYFAKLRDIEILCQSPEIENLPVLISYNHLSNSIRIFFGLLEFQAHFIEHFHFHSFLQVVGAVRKILYAVDDDASVVAEAQVMLSAHQKETISHSSPISEVPSDEKLSLDTQKRKNIINLDVDVAGITTLSPRQRVTDASDVHCSGSPLMTY